MGQPPFERDRARPIEKRVTFEQTFRPMSPDHPRRAGYTEVVDYQTSSGKTMEQNHINAGFLLPDSKLPNGNKENKEWTITEPIMVKNLTGKKCVYFFEEGSHHLLEVIEGDTDAVMPDMVQKVEVEVKRIWREIFSLLRVITSFIILGIVELVFYLTHHVIQPLILNTITTIGNHVLKPLLITVFNNIVQPTSAFVWNTLNALVVAVKPIVDLLSDIVTQVAILLGSFRLFHVDYNSATPWTQKKLETV